MATKTYCRSRGEELSNRNSNDLATKPWNLKTMVYKRKTKEVNGRIIKYLTIEEEDQSKIMEMFTPEMFMTENLIETGAINDLSEMTLKQSTLDTIDSLNRGAGIELDRMDAVEWANKYLKTKSNEKNKNENNKEE